jgi:REP element-mobilizing transposase RayT
MARALRKAFAGGCRKDGFALCQFSIQGNHLHLICEADNHVALARAMQGLGVRAARAINGACGRRGSVFAERYRVTRVTTATQLRNTLVYVLHNARRHGERLRGVDIFSSARYFDGFSKAIALGPAEPGPVPVAEAMTPLLQKRWRYIGLIDPSETPAAALNG